MVLKIFLDSNTETRGSQNTIVAATHEFFFFSLQASVKHIQCVAVKIQSRRRRIKKKKTCDGNILLSLTRGSQNTIVSAAKYILCVAVKIQSHLRRKKKKKNIISHTGIEPVSAG